MSYREYFNIDPEYFPQVDKKLIEEKPDLWKKFWPHPTFVQLLKAMVDVLERKQKLSMWVDGAYGTGKSHAVFTLKKLIEASDEETTAYFEKYGLDNFLCKKLLNQKNEGKILVCHRYGSSDIQSDTDLIVAMQEGIEKALTEAGIENTANTSLKNSLIRFFENEENRQSFDIYAKGTYKTALGGDTSDSVLKKLREYDEEALRSLINKIFKVPAVRNGFSMNTGELCDWIREVIEKNNLKELVFIWDEFSEYFENNMHHLTGFQQIAELAASAPFCLLIVTHKAEGYFSDGDPDKRKILDRFVSPIHISLPENIAFELMNQAMKKTEDEDKAAKWEKNRASLDRRSQTSRAAVRKAINLTPVICFVNPSISAAFAGCYSGLQKIGAIVENCPQNTAYISTMALKDSFPESIYHISQLNNGYDILVRNDPRTKSVPNSFGTPEQWNYALQKMGQNGNWSQLIEGEFGSELNLCHAIASYQKYDDNKKWLYFIALSISGAKENEYLQMVIDSVSTEKELIKTIFRLILTVDKSNAKFDPLYRQRKDLLGELKDCLSEIAEYCKVLATKGENAIYYLTDLTILEKERVIAWLNVYGQKYDTLKLISVLKKVFPDLASYLTKFRFKNKLLDDYFDAYKYQKVVNHILPSFETVVDEQATKMDFVTALKPRAAIVEKLDNSVMDAIIDRFGPDVQTYAGDLQNFRVIEEIAVGKVFFNWIFGFEGKVRIKGPESVKKQYREMVMSAMNLV